MAAAFLSAKCNINLVVCDVSYRTFYLTRLFEKNSTYSSSLQAVMHKGDAVINCKDKRLLESFPE